MYTWGFHSEAPGDHRLLCSFIWLDSHCFVSVDEEQFLTSSCRGLVTMKGSEDVPVQQLVVDSGAFIRRAPLHVSSQF